MSTSEKKRSKVSVQQLCKKIGDNVKRLQDGVSDAEQFDKLCGSIVRTARLLKDGVRKLQGGEGLLSTSGEQLVQQTGAFVETLTQAKGNAAKKPIVDRQATDLYATLAIIKREAGALAKTLVAPAPVAVAPAAAAAVATPPAKSRSSTVLQASGEAAATPDKPQSEMAEAASMEATLEAALDCMNRLEAVVLLQDQSTHKNVEKDTAVQLSTLIRYCKTHHSNRAVADDMFQRTQAMVASGRVAVKDKSAAAEFRRMVSELYSMLTDIIGDLVKVQKQCALLAQAEALAANALSKSATPAAAKAPAGLSAVLSSSSPAAAPDKSPRRRGGTESKSAAADVAKGDVAKAKDERGSRRSKKDKFATVSGAAADKAAPVPTASAAFAKPPPPTTSPRPLGSSGSAVAVPPPPMTPTEWEASGQQQKMVEEQKRARRLSKQMGASGGTAPSAAAWPEPGKVTAPASKDAKAAEAKAAEAPKKRRGLFGRRKEKELEKERGVVRRASVSLSNEEKAEIAKMKFEMEERRKEKERLDAELAAQQLAQQQQAVRDAEAAAQKARAAEQAAEAARAAAEAEQRARQQEAERKRAAEVAAAAREEAARAAAARAEQLEAARRAAEREAAEARAREEEAAAKLRAAEEDEMMRQIIEARREAAARAQREAEANREAEAAAARQREIDEARAREAAEQRAREEAAAAARRREAEAEEAARQERAQREAEARAAAAREAEELRRREEEAERARRAAAELAQQQGDAAARQEEERRRAAAAEEELKAIRMEKLKREREELARAREEEQRALAALQQQEAERVRRAQEAEEAERRRVEEEARRVREDEEQRRARAREQELRRKAEEEALEREEAERRRQEEVERQRREAEQQRQLAAEARRQAEAEVARIEEQVRLARLEQETKRKEELARVEQELADKRRRDEEAIARAAALKMDEEARRKEAESLKLQQEQAQLAATIAARERREREEREKNDKERERLRVLEEQQRAARLKEEELDSAKRLRSSSRAKQASDGPTLGRTSQAAPIVVSKPGFVKVRLCEDCGEEAGVDPFCDMCGGDVIEVEIEAKKPAATKAAKKPAAGKGKKGESDSDDDSDGDGSDADDGELVLDADDNDDDDDEIIALKVCVDCGEEGGDEKACKLCGGDMVALDASDLMDSQIMSPLKGDAAAKLKGQQTGGSPVTRTLLEVGSGPSVRRSERETEVPPVVLTVVKHDATQHDEVFIIDLGSDTIKFGWSNDLEPRRIVNAVFTEDNRPIRPVVDARNGDYVASRMDDVKALLQTVMRLGDYTPRHALFFLSGLPTRSDANEDLVEAAMEPRFTDRVPPCMFVGYAPVLAAFEAQRSVTPTALVIDLGHTHTSVVPVCGGLSVHYAVNRAEMGGSDLLHLIALNANVDAALFGGKRGLALKEALAKGCRVADNFTKAMTEHGYVQVPVDNTQTIRGWKCLAASKDVKVDYSGVALGVASFVAPELLFTPALSAGLPHALVKSLPAMCADSLSQLAPELRDEMLDNVIVTGALARLPGLVERLQAELMKLMPGSPVRVKLGRPHGSWLGAKELASLPAFAKHYCTTQSEAQTILFKYRFLQ